MRLFFVICGLAAIIASNALANSEACKIVIVDADYAAPCRIEKIRGQVERYLNVPITVRTIKPPTGEQSIKEWYNTLQKTRTSNDVFVIGLVSSTNLSAQQEFAPQIGIGIVNVTAIQNPSISTWENRILRLIMRDVAFLAGLPPSQDPFCVTRPYINLTELDAMGLNYFPPSQCMFTERATALGLRPVRDIKAEILKRRALNPPPMPIKAEK